MLPIIKEADFRKELKSNPGTGYLFFGDEDYLKGFAIRQAREVICPDSTFAFFNEFRMDALDFSPQKLLDALMPLPMMTERKLIVLNGLNLNTMRPNESDALCEVLGELPKYDYNLLIVNVAADCLDAGYLPKRPSATLTKLGEYLKPVLFERCTTAKLLTWVGKHFAHHGIEASPALCAETVEYCGHSMFVLSNEIEKLCYYTHAKGEKAACSEYLRQACTPANEYDAFAFANAIMEGNQELALGILADYRFRRTDPLIILGDAVRVICDMIGVRAMTAEGAAASEIAVAMKLHEFKVGLYQKALRNIGEKKLHRTLDACVAADASLKLAPLGYAPLERLICSL